MYNFIHFDFVKFPYFPILQEITKLLFLFHSLCVCVFGYMHVFWHPLSIWKSMLNIIRANVPLSERKTEANPFKIHTILCQRTNQLG